VVDLSRSRPWVGLEAQLAAGDYCRLEGCDALGLAPFFARYRVLCSRKCQVNRQRWGSAPGRHCASGTRLNYDWRSTHSRAWQQGQPRRRYLYLGPSGGCDTQGGGDGQSLVYTFPNSGVTSRILHCNTSRIAEGRPSRSERCAKLGVPYSILLQAPKILPARTLALLTCFTSVFRSMSNIISPRWTA
jgi:hypothetical protein